MDGFLRINFFFFHKMQFRVSDLYSPLTFDIIMSLPDCHIFYCMSSISSKLEQSLKKKGKKRRKKKKSDFGERKDLSCFDVIVSRPINSNKRVDKIQYGVVFCLQTHTCINKANVKNSFDPITSVHTSVVCVQT